MNIWIGNTVSASVNNELYSITFVSGAVANGVFTGVFNSQIYSTNATSTHNVTTQSTDTYLGQFTVGNVVFYVAGFNGSSATVIFEPAGERVDLSRGESCTFNSQCNSSTCTGGVCVDTCTSDNQCNPNESCVNGVCSASAPVVCGDGICDLVNGEDIITDPNYCPADCATATPGGILPGATGAACSVNDDCTSGYCGFDSVCAPVIYMDEVNNSATVNFDNKSFTATLNTFPNPYDATAVISIKGPNEAITQRRVWRGLTHEAVDGVSFYFFESNYDNSTPPRGFVTLALTKLYSLGTSCSNNVQCDSGYCLGGEVNFSGSRVCAVLPSPRVQQRFDEWPSNLWGPFAGLSIGTSYASVGSFTCGQGKGAAYDLLTNDGTTVNARLRGNIKGTEYYYNGFYGGSYGDQCCSDRTLVGYNEFSVALTSGGTVYFYEGIATCSDVAALPNSVVCGDNICSAPYEDSLNCADCSGSGAVVDGGGCVANADCQSGNCDNGLCGVGSTGNVADGSACSSGLDCVSGFCDNGLCGSTPLGGLGSACNFDAHCLDPALICQVGDCTVATSCITDADCSGLICYNSVCRVSIPVCGDGICDVINGEDAASCAYDCGAGGIQGGGGPA